MARYHVGGTAEFHPTANGTCYSVFTRQECDFGFLKIFGFQKKAATRMSPDEYEPKHRKGKLTCLKYSRFMIRAAKRKNTAQIPTS